VPLSTGLSTWRTVVAMRASDLEKLFAALLGLSLVGAKGISCGPCNTAVSMAARVEKSKLFGADAGTAPDASEGGSADAASEAGAATPVALPQLTAEQCKIACGNVGGESTPGCVVNADLGTTLDITCHTTDSSRCIAGRLTEGVSLDLGSQLRDAKVEWIRAAWGLEASASLAFVKIARELRTVGAPRALVQSARRAAREERRHVRLMRALLPREVPPPVVRNTSRTERRSLVAMARENAVEGCVRETFAALVATSQAAHARDVRVRAAMRRIARDETRHAALSFQIAAFLEPRLTPSERATVRHAARAAFEELMAASDSAAIPELGLMTGAGHRALAEGLERALGMDNRRRARRENSPSRERDVLVTV
jgi:rubrerythrin